MRGEEAVLTVERETDSFDAEAWAEVFGFAGAATAFFLVVGMDANSSKLGVVLAAGFEGAFGCDGFAASGLSSVDCSSAASGFSSLDGVLGETDSLDAEGSAEVFGFAGAATVFFLVAGMDANSSKLGVGLAAGFEGAFG